MVLVAPVMPCRSGDTGAGTDTDDGRVTGGTAGTGGAPAAGPASGRELLARLRGDAGARPCFDPGLAGGLRAWLEDAAFEATGGPPEAVPLLLGPRPLLGSDAEDDAPAGPAEAEMLLPRLVHALFRQIVHTGAVGDPLRDALDAVVALGDQRVAEEVARLDDADLAALVTALERHARHLSVLVPRFAATWLPRTDDYVAVPLAGGRVVLHGVFDLLVGLPRPGTASVCALGLATGDWTRQRRTLHYLALLETLRSGVPPFRLALLESATGRSAVEDVREEHLRAMAAHLAGWLARRGVPAGA